MDDYNINSLTDTRNEYSALFINRVTPSIIQGIRSIFNEACKLCADNDEDEKYLMTFQNFLGRISKWNPDIIQTETERIKSESNCNYLEDLLTCVHITQLKILTAVRVGQKQKKIDIDVPKLNDYIHKSYIEVARRVYRNAFLFELNVSPLIRQKHMRELENIVRESLLQVIRDNMPIEQILRAYVDETTEEEVYEVKEDTHEIFEDVSANEEDADVLKKQEEELKELEDDIEKEKLTQEAINAEGAKEQVSIVKSDDVATVDNATTNETETSEIIKVDTESQPTEENISQTVSELPLIVKKDDTPTISNEVSNEIKKLATSGLSFNDNDNVKTYDTDNTSSNVSTTRENIISAPKTIERLEELSEIRNVQRKLEEEEDEDYDDDEKITIFSDKNVSIDALELDDISPKPMKLNNESLLGEITTLA